MSSLLVYTHWALAPMSKHWPAALFSSQVGQAMQIFGPFRRSHVRIFLGQCLASQRSTTPLFAHPHLYRGLWCQAH